jgi:LysM repeat protein
MNSAKTLGMIAVLAAAAGGVYVSLHRNPGVNPSNPSGLGNHSENPSEQAGSSAAESLPPWSALGDQRSSPGHAPIGVNVSLGSGLSAEQITSANPPTSVPGDSATGPEARSAPHSPGGSPQQDAIGGTKPSLPATASRWDASWPGNPASAVDPGSHRSDDNPLESGSTHPFPTRRSEKVPNFGMFMAEVNRELAQGRLAIALQKLSSRYDDLNLSEDEREQILDLLDQIAYAVIYSPESLLEPPYVVQPGDTLQRIAQSYGVPWQLLARINGIADPNSLTPGQKIKVLRGPFDAEIDLPRRELTLKLHGLYAGRFALPLTPDPATLQSVYFVEDKSAVPGQWWIRLSGGTEIRGAHEVSAGSSPASTNLIAVEPDQIENLHTILSVGSRVRILR